MNNNTGKPAWWAVSGVSMAVYAAVVCWWIFRGGIATVGATKNAQGRENDVIPLHDGG